MGNRCFIWLQLKFPEHKDHGREHFKADSKITPVYLQAVDIFLLSNKLLNSLTISMIQKTVRELHLIERPDWTFFLFRWKPIKI